MSFFSRNFMISFMAKIDPFTKVGTKVDCRTKIILSCLPFGRKLNIRDLMMS